MSAAARAAAGAGTGAAPVTILMAVCNGAQALPDQLDSIAAQTHADWRLIASDDGSQDGSPDVIRRFAATRPPGCVDLVAGPGQGFAQNFLSLLARAPSGPVALSDQDDIWFPGKLERALARIAALPADRPALYCSRRINWWPDSGRRRLSRRYPRPPAFANALVENIASGNTIVLNAAAADLARATAPAAAAAAVPFHDWWLYLLVTGVGGTVIHDPEPGLLYRQHARNALGRGEGMGGGLRVGRGLADGSYAGRIGRNVAALQRIADRLTAENRARLDTFAAARRAGLPRRLGLMGRAGVWRQGLAARLGLWVAVCLGRV
jgi:glycosyltransferase involved in cell wall biosynthesis